MVVDPFEFARQQAYREGQMAVADFSRLAKESENAAGSLRWSLQGGASSLGHPQLILTVSVTVQPVCQRCLSPYELTVASQSVLLLAHDEMEADRIEEMLGDEEGVDVIVGSKEMNLMDLVEDEALLALPLSPKHEICPDAAKLDAGGATKLSPFAVLKSLKK